MNYKWGWQPVGIFTSGFTELTLQVSKVTIIKKIGYMN